MLHKQPHLRPSASDILLKLSQRRESGDGEDGEMSDLSVEGLKRENEALKQQIDELRKNAILAPIQVE